ncbi:MAG: fasciclin domain-containing protein [Actinomycetia bacterium]|nr:fasciclin domain-containing protein [Actinomycetes bacterium]
MTRYTKTRPAKRTRPLPVAALAAAATSIALIAAPSAAADTQLVGPGCAGYAEQVPDGPGSVAGMAASPLTVAASNSPVLTTLASAVSGGLNPSVNLVETLDGGQFTVFAPTNDAFAKIDAATLDKLKTDSALLTSILTYHVVPGQAGPDQVVGTHKTVEGADLTVSGGGDHLMVNAANVVCGGIQTTNATVYLIDSVLLPPAA